MLFEPNQQVLVPDGISRPIVNDARKKEQPFQRYYVSTCAQGSRTRRSYVDGLNTGSSTFFLLARDRNESNFGSYVLEWLLWAPSFFGFHLRGKTCWMGGAVCNSK